MRVGYLATLFDKIQHAYGWTDDIILDLTLKRAIQIREAIDQRQEFARWEDHKILEWAVTTVSSIVANTPQDKEHRKQLNEVVGNISLTSGKADTTSKGKKSQATYRTKSGQVVTASELKNYSYDEIDHSEQERAATEAARKKNAGLDLAAILSGSTKR